MALRCLYLCLDQANKSKTLIVPLKLISSYYWSAVFHPSKLSCIFIHILSKYGRHIECAHRSSRSQIQAGPLYTSKTTLLQLRKTFSSQVVLSIRQSLLLKFQSLHLFFSSYSTHVLLVWACHGATVPQFA